MFCTFTLVLDKAKTTLLPTRNKMADEECPKESVERNEGTKNENEER
jgi:hypothetical protein